MSAPLSFFFSEWAGVPSGRASSIYVPHLRYALLFKRWVAIAHGYSCVPPWLGHGCDLCHVNQFHSVPGTQTPLDDLSYAVSGIYRTGYGFRCRRRPNRNAPGLATRSHSIGDIGERLLRYCCSPCGLLLGYHLGVSALVGFGSIAAVQIC